MNEPCVCGPNGTCPSDCENRRKPARAESVTLWTFADRQGRLYEQHLRTTRQDIEILIAAYPEYRPARVEIREIEE